MVSMRQLLMKNSVVTLAAAILALGASVWILIGNINSGPSFDQKWMFDLNTGTLVLAPITELAPSGFADGRHSYPNMDEAGSLVDAILFGCEGHGRAAAGMTPEQLAERDIHIGYLSRYPDSVMSDLALGEPLSGEPVELIAEVPGKKWVKIESLEGDRIRDGLMTLCGGELPRAVRP